MINIPIYSHLAALNELFPRHILSAEECSEVARKKNWNWEYHLTQLLLTKSAVVVQETVHVLKIRGYSVKNELQSELCYSSTVQLISEWLCNGKWSDVIYMGNRLAVYMYSVVHLLWHHAICHYICCAISHMHLSFWTTILKFTVLHLCQLDSGTCANCMTAFMYFFIICLTMNSKLYDNHTHPHTLEYTCMLLPVGYPNQVSPDHVNLMQWSSPGLLLFPCGLHLRRCSWVRWSGILRTWLSHCSRLCFSCFSTGTSPTCFMTLTFLCLSQSVSPRMSCRHCIWNFLSLLISTCATGQVSAPYRRIDITSVQKARIFIAFPRFQLLNNVPPYIWYTFPAFSNLTVTFFSTLTLCPTSLPR